MITPGSWKVDGGKGKDGDLYIWKGGNYFGGHAIATVHGEIQEGAEGNARLIAASPDLLEALKALTKEINLGKLNIRKNFSLINAHACALRIIRKAEGDS